MPRMPAGYIVPDGRPLSREDYPQLFEALSSVGVTVLSEPEFVGPMPRRVDVPVRLPSPEIRRMHLYTEADVELTARMAVRFGAMADMTSDDPLESL